MRHVPEDHPVQHDAQSVQIAARIDGFTDRLFGAHVRGRAEQDTGAGLKRGVHVVVDDLGDPEVDDLHGLVAVGFDDEDVRGFEIAVNHPLSVRVLESSEDLVDQAQGVPRGEIALAEDLAERSASQARHDHEVHAAVRGPVVVDLEAVGVVEARHALRLALESLRAAHGVGDLRVEDFHGDGALELELHAPKDDPHPAGSDHLVEAVGARDRLAEQVRELVRDGLGVRHRRPW